MQAKFVAFLRARNLKKLRFNSCKKRLRRMKQYEIEIILCQNDTETVREQFCDLAYYLGDVPEDRIENPIYQSLIEIIYEVAKGHIPALHIRHTTLLIKHVNEKNKEFNIISTINFSELKYVARESALSVIEKFSLKKDHTTNKKEQFWKRRIEKNIAILRRSISRSDYWFKEK